MRIAFANACYNPNIPSGGNAHIKQFIDNAILLGHEVWAWPDDMHPHTFKFPVSPWKRMYLLRKMNVLYIRVEGGPPRAIRWSTGLRRRVIGDLPVIWEFNTVPEIETLNNPSMVVDHAVSMFQKHATGCSLGVCVSDKLADYVRDRLKVERTLVVPNGSDPQLFHEGVLPFARIQRLPECLNVTWMGSGEVPWHDFHLLRDATNRLWEMGKGANFHFHIIGSGIKNLREFPPNVFYHGPENYSNIPAWQAAMDIGLVLYKPGPADYSSPLKLFDYMASGLTVISTEQDQVRNIFEEMDQTDLIIPKGSSDQLVEKLLYLHEHRDRIKSQGKRGRHLVVSKYNWNTNIRIILSEVEKLVTQGQNAIT